MKYLNCRFLFTCTSSVVNLITYYSLALNDSSESNKLVLHELKMNAILKTSNKKTEIK